MFFKFGSRFFFLGWVHKDYVIGSWWRPYRDSFNWEGSVHLDSIIQVLGVWGYHDSISLEGRLSWFSSSGWATKVTSLGLITPFWFHYLDGWGLLWFYYLDRLWWLHHSEDGFHHDLFTRKAEPATVIPSLWWVGLTIFFIIGMSYSDHIIG